MPTPYEAIEAREEELRQAMLAGDVARLDGLLDPELMFTGPDGSMASKADDLAAHRAGVVKMTRMDLVNRHIKVWDGWAAAAVMVDLAGLFQGQPFEGRYGYTRFWRLTDGVWRVVAGQVAKFEDPLAATPPAPPVTEGLVRAYETANYHITQYPHDFVFHIGHPSPKMDSLLWDYSVPAAIFITACNPHSQKLSPAENKAANDRLRKDLDAMGAVVILEGAGEDPRGLWPEEPGFLALDLSVEKGKQLAKDFGQNAFVYVAAGKAPELVFTP
jgi:hypothetical protein